MRIALSDTAPKKKFIDAEERGQNVLRF